MMLCMKPFQFSPVLNRKSTRKLSGMLWKLACTVRSPSPASRWILPYAWTPMTLKMKKRMANKKPMLAMLGRLVMSVLKSFLSSLALLMSRMSLPILNILTMLATGPTPLPLMRNMRMPKLVPRTTMKSARGGVGLG
jgi:hypothetical protein